MPDAARCKPRSPCSVCCRCGRFCRIDAVWRLSTEYLNASKSFFFDREFGFSLTYMNFHAQNRIVRRIFQCCSVAKLFIYTIRTIQMRNTSIAIAVSLRLLLWQKCDAMFDTFIGPGVVECSQGECEFSIQAGIGCSDPCHTRTHSHMYDSSFADVAEVSVDQSNDNTIDEQCFFQYAKHIDAQYPDWYVDIEEGCTAKCNGCIFAPTVMFRKWLFEYSSF